MKWLIDLFKVYFFGLRYLDSFFDVDFSKLKTYMETFRFLLFGFAGVSLVVWVAIIALWHAYMFPRFFNEDKGLNSVINQEIKVSTDPILGSLVKSNNFRNRDKYSMKSFVIADFSSASNNFKLNKLYTTVMIGVTFASFIFLTYGLSSSITTVS